MKNLNFIANILAFITAILLSLHFALAFVTSKPLIIEPINCVAFTGLFSVIAYKLYKNMKK